MENIINQSTGTVLQYGLLGVVCVWLVIDKIKGDRRRDHLVDELLQLNKDTVGILTSVKEQMAVILKVIVK